jgi:hypothetical protein
VTSLAIAVFLKYNSGEFPFALQSTYTYPSIYICNLFDESVHKGKICKSKMKFLLISMEKIGTRSHL